jgi:hypothetical protein
MDNFVIFVGTMGELLWLREEVLKGAGFRVLTMANEKHTLAHIK